MQSVFVLGEDVGLKAEFLKQRKAYMNSLVKTVLLIHRLLNLRLLV